MDSWFDMYVTRDSKNRWRYTLEEIIVSAQREYKRIDPDWTDRNLEDVAEEVRDVLFYRFSESYAQDLAAALYDGGWRSTDRSMLIRERRLTDEQADQICELFDKFDGVGFPIM